MGINEVRVAAIERRLAINVGYIVVLTLLFLFYLLQLLLPFIIGHFRWNITA